MYQGVSDYQHTQADRTGLLITNLGTPDAPEPAALRRYLKEFLWDPRVVEIPRLVWWFILHGIILTIRPKRSAAAYRTIWTERGSPLHYHTQDQCQALRERLTQDFGDDIRVAFAMRYGNPSIASAVQELQDQGVRKLLVLPLYPQYSGATTASTFDAIARDFRQRRWLPELRMINHYPDFDPYIDALAQHIRQHQAEHGHADKLVLSYHGVPRRYLLLGDPYFCECHKTSRLLAEKLGLNDRDYITTFQSRFGKAEWLKPYTDQTLTQLARDGVRSVQVICPGFAADCLETLEEIAVENRDYFLQAGGHSYQYIPALNASASHLDALEALVRQHLQGWEPLGKPRAQKTATADRANALAEHP